jgi:hypothetical protein
MSGLVIVTCGASKASRPLPAADLYTGGYYRMCLAYARTLAPDSNIRILSALHGLLPLDRVVAPYEMSVGDAGAISPDALRRQAGEQGLLFSRPVVVIGGRRYHGLAVTVWPRAKHALAGRGGMGKQLAWMRDQLKAAA